MFISNFKKLFTSIVISGAVVLTGCSGGGAGGSSAPTTSPTTSLREKTILLSTTSASVKSDNSNASTITATVLDINNAVLAGEIVTFSTPSGQLGAVSGPSSSSGKVTIDFSSGADQTNRTAVITASVSGTTATNQTAIQVTGSTLAVVASVTTLQVGGVPATASFTATAKDAANAGVTNQSIRVSIPAGNGVLSGGTGSTTSQIVTTVGTGVAPPVVLTPAAAGTVLVTTEWLNSAGTVTLTDTKTITVNAVGIAFAVTSPATSPTALALDAAGSPGVPSTQVINVSVPTKISGVDVANVRFATTLGTWLNEAKVSVNHAPVGNAVSETLQAGSASGTANVQIDALDGSGNVLVTLNWVFSLSAAASTANTISLQPSVSNVAPNTGGTKTNSSTLTATVRDIGLNTVSGAAVLFEIVNPTGSGEEIAPVLGTTNSSGQAVSTFFSGSQSTVGGLTIKASIVSNPAISDTKTINVAGSGVSASLGASSSISASPDNTLYLLPMSVLVVSNAGTAVAGATVSLSAFPTRYYRGSRAIDCGPIYEAQTVGAVLYAAGVGVPSEDLNENDILDGGEDANGDGLLTPAHSMGGSVPATVTTDASGSASFTLTYQKQYASWIRTRIRAKTVVSGTESTTEYQFILQQSSADSSAPCSLPASPGYPQVAPSGW